MSEHNPPLTGSEKTESAVPRPGLGSITRADLSKLDSLYASFVPDSFYRQRPPLSHEALDLSLELAAMTYDLELDEWMAAGWTDVSIQIDNTLQSGVTRGESASGIQMHTLLNSWKLYRAKSALREANPIAQMMGALRQREKSDTIKAVTMLHKLENGRYLVAIGFMGTGTRFYDWFSNFRFTVEDGFHKGFSQLTEHFEESAPRILFPDTAAELGLAQLTLEDILLEMTTADSRFSLWMAGHSQGGAVMQVFCHRLIHQWGVLPQNMVGYGFASPTVATGLPIYDPAGYPLYHVLNSDDVVPRVGALLHLGLCLQYDANGAFRETAYFYSGDPKARKELQNFVDGMTNSLAFMEQNVAFFRCLLEEKADESLASLIDKKWTIAPIEWALNFAGDKLHEALLSMIRYIETAHTSLTGQGLNPKRVAELQEQIRPTIKGLSVRQLLGGLNDLLLPAHHITQAHNTAAPGAYAHIVLHNQQDLHPFIWVKRTIPERHFAQTALWQDDFTALTSSLSSVKRRPSRASATAKPRAKKDVRTKGISARRGIH